MNIIPTSAISAFAENELLQVLFFAVLFGLALAKIGEKAPIVLGFVDQSSHVFFTMIGWIMKLAPLGAFGAMAYIIGQYGISSLGSYGKLIACCYLAAVLFILVLGVINFETEADNVHTSTNTNNPNTTSAKGSWRKINCP